LHIVVTASPPPHICRICILLTHLFCFLLLALLWLRHRKVVLKHLRKLTDNLEKSKTDPNFQLQPDTEKARQLDSVYHLHLDHQRIWSEAFVLVARVC